MRVRYKTTIAVLMLAAVAVGQDSSRRSEGDRSSSSSERDRSSSSSSDRERSSSSSSSERDRSSSSERDRSSSSSDRDRSSSYRDRSSSSDRDRSSRSYRNGSSSYSSSSSSGSTTQPAGFLDHYRLVLDRNIFSRNRVIYREPGASTTTAPSGSYRTEPALLLTGVTLEGAVATASIEDKRSGRTALYHVGDGLGDGKIAAINIDSIEFATSDGRVTRVDLGRAIEGGPTHSVSSSGGSYSSSSSSSTSGTPSSSSTPTPTATGAEADMLEKLRQKRLQETKK